MPFILTTSTTRPQGAAWRVTARTALASGGSWPVFAVTRPETRGASWPASARTLVPVLGTSWATGASTDGSGGPAEVIRGGPLLEVTQAVTGLPGTVLTWEYGHSGAAEELTVVVAGQHGLAQPTATLRAEGQLVDVDGKASPLDRLGPRTFRDIGAEPEVDMLADTTTFRFKNAFDRELRGVRLPELIPWKLNPSPGGDCGGTRQRRGVSALVMEAMRDHVDRFFVLEDDPFAAGAEWIEGERDFTTLNLTPQALWDQTYGLLGMVLHVRPRGPGIRLVGRWPQPIRDPSGSRPPEHLTLARTERREMLQTPATLTLRGASFLTVLAAERLLEWVGDDPARQEIERAVYRDAEWFEGPLWAETGQVRRGFRRLGGQMVAQVEFTTGDVTASETVDGQEVRREFRGVLLGYKHTASTYDPLCPDRPLLQVTRTHAWGYTPFTETGTFIVAGPGVYSAAPAGDLASSEETVTTFTYSPQGWLASRTTTSRRLASLQQQDAEEEGAKRGRLEAREVVTTMRTESWRPTGAGRWLYDPGTSGQSLVPVYDKESGEAVRTTSLTRAAPTPPEITDQAPPSYRCGDASCPKRVLDDTGVILVSGDAGFAEEAEIQVPFLDPSHLEAVARRVLTSQWWRIVSTFQVPYPVGVSPGDGWGGGVVRELRVSGSSAGVDSSVTVARRDPLMPVTPRVQGITAEPSRGRAVMLSGKPGGARVRIVRGWDPQARQPVVEDGFVAFRSGFPPSPGDEIEWRLNPATGQREAVSASV